MKDPPQSPAKLLTNQNTLSHKPSYRSHINEKYHLSGQLVVFRNPIYSCLAGPPGPSGVGDDQDGLSWLGISWLMRLGGTWPLRTRHVGFGGKGNNYVVCLKIACNAS